MIISDSTTSTVASTDPATGTSSASSVSMTAPGSEPEPGYPSTSEGGAYPTIAPPPPPANSDGASSDVLTTASTGAATGSADPNDPGTSTAAAEDPTSTVSDPGNGNGGGGGGGYPSSVCYKGYGTDSICFPVPAAATEPGADSSTATGSMTTFIRANVVVPTPAAEVEAEQAEQAEPTEAVAAADGDDKRSGWGWFQGWGRREAAE